MNYEKELALALKASNLAGDFLKARQGIKVDDLTGKDIKLSSDKESEAIILDCLQASGIPVLSEECGFKGEKGEYCWIVDPIDGTQNYFRGMDELVCVSIALWKDGKPVLGVVNRFDVGEVFHGVVGQGAYLNNEPMSPSGIAETSQAIMASGFPVKRDYSTEALTPFIKQVQSFKKVRMFGTAALMCTFVAAGRVDAYFEDEIMLWDIAAAVAIVQAAGGATEVELLNDNKCICRCFATKELLEDYHAKGL